MSVTAFFLGAADVKKLSFKIIINSALKQWKSNDISSIDYYAIIIVVYYMYTK